MYILHIYYIIYTLYISEPSNIYVYIYIYIYIYIRYIIDVDIDIYKVSKYPKQK